MMNGIKKIFNRNLDLFLPLAAVLLGILIMAFQKPTSVQAATAVPMPQSFLGEYSNDGMIWHPLESNENLSALNSDLYLRGHFASPIPSGSLLYFFADHIASEIFVNGELIEQDVILEVEKYGIKTHPSMCSREWKFYYFGNDVSVDDLIEIHIKNPHTFGNKNAYRYFLDTLCCTPKDQEILKSHLAGAAHPYNVTGLILTIVGVLLLCAALVSIFLRLPLNITIVQTGLLAVCAGGCFLLDTIDLIFRSDNHIVNTYGWQICMMYSVYFLGIMARDMLEEKQQRVATYVMRLSEVVNIVIILMSFAGVVLIYDTLRFWVMLQLIICPLLGIFFAAELFFGDKNKRADLIVFLIIFICISLDCMGVFGNIYSRCVMTKSAVILFFLLKLIQFVRSIIINSKASSRAHKLEKELEESRIVIMLSQIRPHFIFNVLGTLRGLCRENPEEAWRGLGDFSAYLRANMYALTNEKSIPFEMELAHVEAYLRLEQMRMGKRLNVIYDIQEKDFFIPPLTLQPLVENAVKHGLFYKSEGGTVTIRSVQNDGSIVLSVHDDGIGFEAADQIVEFEQHEHYGLINVRSRVEKMLGGTLQIDSYPDQGSTVTVEFPISDHS